MKSLRTTQTPLASALLLTIIFTLILALALSLATPVPAQSKSYATMPPGFLTVEGEAYASGLGNYPNNRWQLLRTQFTGKGAKSFREVSFRKDGSSTASTFNSQGRTWNVSLDMHETDFAKRTTTFTANHTTSPVRVFTGTVTWPAFTGTQPKPGAWGTKAFTFPFKKPFLYTGKWALGMDFMFTGGTLANNASWGTSQPRYYHLDGRNRVVNYYRGYGWIYENATCCRDSSQVLHGYHRSSSYVYAPNHTDAQKAGKMWTYFEGYRTAKNSRVALAMNFGKFGGTPFGIPFAGVTCEKPKITTDGTMLLFFGMADATGRSRIEFGTNGHVAWNPIFAGAVIWSQMMWDDKLAKRPLMTGACRLTIPSQPAASPYPPSYSYYDRWAPYTGAYGSDSASYLPICRMTW